jgi:hypothetical protein
MISKNKLDVVVHIYNPNYTGGVSRRIKVKGQPRRKSSRLSKKQLKQKRNRGMVQGIEHCINKHKAQS